MKRYILVFLFLILAGFVKAQTNGCYVAATGRMYYQTPTPANPTTYFEGSAYYVNLAQCSNDGQYFSFASGPTGTTCYAHYKGSGSKTSGSRYNISGKKATFNVLNCPIDTHTLILMAGMAGTGAFYLRRRATA